MYLNRVFQVAILLIFLTACTDSSVHNVVGKVTNINDSTVSVCDSDNQIHTFDINGTQVLGGHVVTDDSVNVYYKGTEKADITKAVVLELLVRQDMEQHPLAHFWRFERKALQDTVRGIILRDNGTAESVNLPDIELQRWEKHGNELILKGNRTQGKDIFEINDTYKIERIDNDSLIICLQQNDALVTYRLRKDD